MIFHSVLDTDWGLLQPAASASVVQSTSQRISSDIPMTASSSSEDEPGCSARGIADSSSEMEFDVSIYKILQH